MKEVVFEKDPQVAQTLDKFRTELKNSQKQESLSKQKLLERESELSRLRDTIDKLRKAESNFKPQFGSQHNPDSRTITSYVMSRRTEILERLFNFIKKKQNLKIKEFCFAILKMNRSFARMKNFYEKKEEQKLENLKKMKPNEALYVWSRLREGMTDWLFDLFVRSSSESEKNKTNSFVLFKINLEQLARTLAPILALLLPAYLGLYCIIFEMLPAYRLKPVSDVEYFKQLKLEKIG